jgi:uncharacterized membrane protein YtjA (UPF0391 family)
MLRWSLILLVATLVAALLGFSGMFVSIAGVAKTLFFVLLLLFVVSLITGSFLERPLA